VSEQRGGKLRGGELRGEVKCGGMVKYEKGIKVLRVERRAINHIFSLQHTTFFALSEMLETSELLEMLTHAITCQV
jgi:hypothetical protein